MVIQRKTEPCKNSEQRNVKLKLVKDLQSAGRKYFSEIEFLLILQTSVEAGLLVTAEKNSIMAKAKTLE